ncbi:hypothetical protein EG878_17510, partial [Enterococcus faecalis]
MVEGSPAARATAARARICSADEAAMSFLHVQPADAGQHLLGVAGGDDDLDAVVDVGDRRVDGDQDVAADDEGGAVEEG